MTTPTPVLSHAARVAESIAVELLEHDVLGCTRAEQMLGGVAEQPMFESAAFHLDREPRVTVAHPNSVVVAHVRQQLDAPERGRS